MATYTARLSTRPLVPHLHIQRIQVNDPIHRLQRPVLPSLDFNDSVGHLRDQRRAHIYSVHLLQMPLDLPRGHAPRVQRQDLFVEPIKPGLVLLDDLWFETAAAIARRFDCEPLPKITFQRLGSCAVAGVTIVIPG